MGAKLLIFSHIMHTKTKKFVKKPHFLTSSFFHIISFSYLCTRKTKEGCFPEWPNGADCKSAVFRLRWFESISTHKKETLASLFFSLTADFTDFADSLIIRICVICGYFLKFLVLWTQLADCLTSTPHLLITHCLELFLQSCTIVGLRVCIDGNLSLITCLY